MPIFEYTCQSCKKDFETLVRGSEKPKCPHCGSAKLEKRISSFSAKSETKSGGGHHCCCGNCHCHSH